MLNQTFAMPDEFNIHAYLEGEFKEQSVIRAHLHFIPEAGQMVKGNRSLWEAIKENLDGSVEVVLASPDLSFLASMVMSFSPLVTVLEPPELRTMVQQLALSTVNLYDVQQL